MTMLLQKLKKSNLPAYFAMFITYPFGGMSCWSHFQCYYVTLLLVIQTIRRSILMVEDVFFASYCAIAADAVKGELTIEGKNQSSPGSTQC